MPNMNKLKGKIKENQSNYSDCATVLGISLASFNQKINAKTALGFGMSEVATLSGYLKLTDEEKLSIFFN